MMEQLVDVFAEMSVERIVVALAIGVLLGVWWAALERVGDDE